MWRNLVIKSGMKITKGNGEEYYMFDDYSTGKLVGLYLHSDNTIDWRQGVSLFEDIVEVSSTRTSPSQPPWGNLVWRERVIPVNEKYRIADYEDSKHKLWGDR